VSDSEPLFDARADAVCAVCAACGSSDVTYDPADGWCCHSCHATDADE
jgi:hypothetical protein